MQYIERITHTDNELLKDLNLSRFADFANMRQPNLAKIRTGKYKPSKEYYEKLVKKVTEFRKQETLDNI